MSRKTNYSHFVEPIGFPNTASICGRKNCNTQGYIWLDSNEFQQFQNGERIFKFPTAASKVKVSNTIKP